ncbi:Hypothetical predicted protein [Pelobates cultripes]|uniref:Uncharacterized protein n=1 Tax=Pelobates cultripes TaxID=61616 RepID=A0AAD1S4J8_PELCU|nr:Hypothetical predicted protein [Pelobates cultripes]
MAADQAAHHTLAQEAKHPRGTPAGTECNRRTYKPTWQLRGPEDCNAPTPVWNTACEPTTTISVWAQRLPHGLHTITAALQIGSRLTSGYAEDRSQNNPPKPRG